MIPMRTPLFSPELMPKNRGIASLLSPIIQAVSQDYKQDVVDPYIQEVEQLTTRTFPEVQFGSPLGQGGGGLGTYGPIGTLQGTTVMGNPFATDPIRPFNPTNIPPELIGQGAGIMGTLGPLVR